MSLLNLDPEFYNILYDKYETALKENHLIFNGETAIHETINRKVNGKSFQFELTLLQSLQHRPEVGNVNDNPFAKPEPELTILPSFGIKDEFRIVFNKFPVVPAHFMIVTKEFKSQDTPLSPNELVATFSVLRELKACERDKEWFAFYNCGPESGASQPHKHIQFMTLPKGFVSFAEELANTSSPFIPNQNQEPLQDPDMPFAHFVAKLPDNPEDLTEEVLAMTFVSLLQRCLTVLKENEESHISYNFCATTKFMMLVPRSTGKFDQILGINSCGVMGLILCKDEELANLVRTTGPEIVLEAIGLPNTSGKPSDEYNY